VDLRVTSADLPPAVEVPGHFVRPEDADILLGILPVKVDLVAGVWH
jgi:hypothetical protein